jgi:hypothetical protein
VPAPSGLNAALLTTKIPAAELPPRDRGAHLRPLPPFDLSVLNAQYQLAIGAPINGGAEAVLADGTVTWLLLPNESDAETMTGLVLVQEQDSGHGRTYVGGSLGLNPSAFESANVYSTGPGWANLGSVVIVASPTNADPATGTALLRFGVDHLRDAELTTTGSG